MNKDRIILVLSIVLALVIGYGLASSKLGRDCEVNSAKTLKKDCPIKKEGYTQKDKDCCDKDENRSKYKQVEETH